jgi:hypothetical protein
MNDNMGDQEFYNFLLSAYRCMHANLADDGSIYVWHADTEGLNFRKAFKDAGFYLSGAVSGRRTAWSWAGVPISGFMSRACSVEAEGQAPVVQRPQADHRLGI